MNLLKKILVLVLLMSFNYLNANHYFKIDIKKLDKDQNILVTDLTSGSGSENTDILINPNSSENITLWSNYLKNNAEPYKDPLFLLSTIESNVQGSMLNISLTDADLIEEMPLVNGLNNTIASLFIISKNITRISGMTNIQEITNGMLLIDNGISDFSGLSGLQRALYLQIDNNTSTVDLSFLNNYEQGAILINGSNVSNLNMLNENWQCSNISMIMSNITTLNYPNLKKIFNSDCLGINFAGNSLTDLRGLEGITSINNMNFSNNNLVDLSALSNLVTIGRLVLNQNTNLTGLENLTTITTELAIRNTNINNLDALSNLVSANTIDFITNNLVNIEGLNGLMNITGNISIEDNSGLQNVEGLRNLQNVSGSLSLIRNDLLNVDGLRNLETARDIFLLYNDNLTDISGLSNLSSVTGDIILPIRNMTVKLPSTSFICQNLGLVNYGSVLGNTTYTGYYCQ